MPSHQTDRPTDALKLGEWIANTRRRLGLNQADFGAACGVTQGMVSKWERNLEQPRYDAVMKIERVANGEDHIEPPVKPEPVRKSAEAEALHLHVVDRIKARIEALGTNVSAVAVAAGLGRTSVRDIIARKALSPTLSTLLAICRPLDCSIAYLLGLDDGFGNLPHEITDLAKLGPVQPDHKALPAKETREGEVRTAVEPSRVSELREQIEELSDLLHALDKMGDGIGGADGYAVSAVALNAKSIADNALGIAKVLGGRS